MFPELRLRCTFTKRSVKVASTRPEAGDWSYNHRHQIKLAASHFHSCNAKDHLGHHCKAQEQDSVEVESITEVNGVGRVTDSNLLAILHELFQLKS